VKRYDSLCWKLIIVWGLPLTASAKANVTWYTYNGHDYALSNPGTWSECQAEAESYGGYLVSINDAKENEWVANTFAPLANAWIGLYQPPGTGEPAEGWQWISAEPVVFFNWGPGQPNEYLDGDDRALMHCDPSDPFWGMWHDVSPDGYPPSTPYPHYGIMEIPEPATISLLVLGGLALIRRRPK